MDEEFGSPDAFTRMGTLGVEEEFYVVDENGHPIAGTDELVYEHEPPDPLAGRIDHELFKFVIETQTPLIERPADAERTIRCVRNALVEYAEAHGYRIAAAGLHPAARWRELDHATKPRYRSQLDRIQYPQHRNTTAGLHVHVGVDDADKATWVANELRWYLPPLLALSANSPYWNGFDTGLASARAKIFEALPNTGMPTAFADFEAYSRFERRMVETEAINDRGELWYDVRPHTGHGTVEVRTPDAQADPSRVHAFVEYVHALVVDLAERYEDSAEPETLREADGSEVRSASNETAPSEGPESRSHGPPAEGGDGAGPQLPWRGAETGAGPRRELLDENKWRAIRYGHEATFITPDGEGTIPLAEFVDRECDRLGVAGLRRLLDRESGAERQRRIREAEGFDALCGSLFLS